MKAYYWTNGDIKVIKTAEDVPYENYGRDAIPQLKSDRIAHVLIWGRNLDIYTVALANGIAFTLNKTNYEKAKKYFFE